MNTLTTLSGNTLRQFTLLAAAFCLSLAAGIAGAEEQSKPCADDAARLCKGMQPGGGRIANCLREHRDELSPACKERMAAAKKRMQEAKDDCHEDMQKHCKDVQPGQGRIAQCLKQHEAELSADCKAHLAKPRGERR